MSGNPNEIENASVPKQFQDVQRTINNQKYKVIMSYDEIQKTINALTADNIILDLKDVIVKRFELAERVDDAS